MRYTHQELIKESEADLTKLLKQPRHTVIASRLKVLNQLQTKEATSVAQAAQKIDYRWSHPHRWLTAYQAEGIAARLLP